MNVHFGLDQRRLQADRGSYAPDYGPLLAIGYNGYMVDDNTKQVARGLCTSAGINPDEMVLPPLGFQRTVIDRMRTDVDRVPAWTLYVAQAHAILNQPYSRPSVPF